MIRSALLATLLLLACAACSREEPARPDASPAAPAPAAAPAAAPVQAPVAAAAAAATAEDPAAGFDKGAFAGTFSGGGLRLELHGDGTYGLEAPTGASQGTWTYEADSRSVRLDPGSKTETDRVFRATGRDALAAIDASGQPAGAPLRRQPMP